MRVLDLPSNGIDGEAFARFTPALAYLTNLADLSLGNNNIRSFSVNTFASFKSSLTALFLDENGINDTALSQM
jgi:hypothetical protein